MQSVGSPLALPGTERTRVWRSVGGPGGSLSGLRSPKGSPAVCVQQPGIGEMVGAGPSAMSFLGSSSMGPSGGGGFGGAPPRPPLLIRGSTA
ncbi:hypothetical protein AVEN_35540-1 [Araneus ventricosus]|uniref:Uncharacterized protein n=1 Tax=Araneus ventricosus TaxID=182803 RepID=A0A4Y2HLQ5_ARAVE|nr:hypothetical protein AVEN_35540-1 [Araneus ventricosus]